MCCETLQTKGAWVVLEVTRCSVFLNTLYLKHKLLLLIPHGLSFPLCLEEWPGEGELCFNAA